MNQFLKYIFEVREDDIRKIGSRVNSFVRKETTEPFNDLFGGNARLVVPITSKEQIDFEEFLDAIGLKNIDLKKGTGYRTVQSQKGDNQQEVRIGKFIQNYKEKSFKSGNQEDAKEAEQNLSWWEKNKDKLGNVNSDQGVSVIISRNPIDLLRMSDHKEFSSCHAPGEEWYKCAIQEALTGGAIAYVVRNSDLSKIKNLQIKDIFKDKDRKIDGIEPLERVRLRRFVDSKNEYLVPETRTYGIKHVGLYKTVKDWAAQVQKERLKDPDFKDMKLTGGSYMDNDASKLWTSFLGRDVDVEVETEKGKNEQDQITDAQVEEVINGHSYKHFFVMGDVDQINGADYVYYSAQTVFKFPVSRMIRIPEYGDEDKIQWRLSQDISRKVDIYSIEDVNFEVHQGEFLINVDIRDDDGAGTLESLERFLDQIDSYEQDYNKSYSQVEYLLWNNGIYNLPIDNIEFKYLEMEEPEEDEIKYKFIFIL